MPPQRGIAVKGLAAVPVGELELDLDAFEGPFDLLLSLVLRDELELRELDLAEIVIAFVVTGVCVSSAKRVSSAAACANHAPPPARIAGRFASRSHLSSCASAALLGPAGSLGR